MNVVADESVDRPIVERLRQEAKCAICGRIHAKYLR